jgi:hypothetical protein
MISTWQKKKEKKTFLGKAGMTSLLLFIALLFVSLRAQLLYSGPVANDTDAVLETIWLEKKSVEAFICLTGGDACIFVHTIACEKRLGAEKHWWWWCASNAEFAHQLRYVTVVCISPQAATCRVEFHLKPRYTTVGLELRRGFCTIAQWIANGYLYLLSFIGDHNQQFNVDLKCGHSMLVPEANAEVRFNARPHVDQTVTNKCDSVPSVFAISMMVMMFMGIAGCLTALAVGISQTHPFNHTHIECFPKNITLPADTIVHEVGLTRKQLKSAVPLLQKLINLGASHFRPQPDSPLILSINENKPVGGCVVTFLLPYKQLVSDDSFAQLKSLDFVTHADCRPCLSPHFLEFRVAFHFPKPAEECCIAKSQ